MTDDPSKRRHHRDARSRADTPRAGVAITPPAFGVVGGECDSDDGGRSTLQAVAKVEVDPRAFDADVRWEQFDEMRAEVAACKREREDRLRRVRWLNPLRNLGVGTLIAALLWTVRALDQRGAESEKARQRNAQIEQALRDIRQIQDWKIGIDILMGIRRRDNREPPRNDP